MRLLFVAGLLLVAAAGCADPPHADAEEAPTDPAADPATEPRSDDSTVVVGASPNGAITHETIAWRDVIDLTLPYGVPFAPYDQQDPQRLDVAEEVTAVLVEVVWDDMTTDLNAYALPDTCPTDVLDPDVECEVGITTRTTHWHEARGGGPGAGDSPSRLFLPQDVLASECTPCAWTFGAHSETAAVQVVADVFVTMFYGDVPEGFTAIPA